MKKQIVIIGSGFAGMWAAVGAARLIHLQNREDVTVTVLAPHKALRIRPRFYEDNAETLSTPLGPLFNEVDIQFIQGYTEAINPS